MGNVRKFCFKDLGEVADLWARVFAPHSGISLSSLEKYFEEVFLASPWSDCALSSLVYEDQSRVVGFLGVLPRRMYFSGKPVTVAVASQLMMDPAKPRPFASIELLRNFFAGPQDLSFSDGANDVAQTVWESAGGSVAMLYSSVWTRVLRPAQYSMALFEDKRLWHPLPMALRPFCWAVDGVMTRVGQSPYKLSAPDLGKTETVADAAVLLDCVRQFSANRTLRPEYDLTSFQWLIRKATEQKTHGDLQIEVVRGPSQEIIGSYAYYVKPGRTAQVLQFTGKPRHRAQVLEHLFYRARQKGAVAVSGQLEPAFARLLSKNHCRFTWSGGVLIQSRDEKLLNTIHHGDAFLSRLEGEWWMKFCDMAAS
jgi:hypothetical protein